MLRARIAGAGFLIASLLLLGCDDNKAPCKLTGKVTYKDSAVTGGTITVVSADGNVFPIFIGPDGKFEFPRLPEGAMTVTIETESISPDKKQEYRGASSPAAGKYAPKGGGPAGPPAASKAKGQGAKDSPMPEGANVVKPVYVKIPLKYGNKDKSGLTVTLKKGDNKQDFNLTD